MLSNAALEEFKKIWREEFGEEISDDQAVEIGAKLVNVFDCIYRPVKKKWLEDSPKD